MKENTKNKFGYPFYDESDVKIAYSINLIDMQNPNNNVFVLLLMEYLKSHGDPFGRVKLSLNEIVLECGYFTKSKSKTYHKNFRDVIEKFIDEELLIVDDSFDISNIKNTDFFTVQLNKENDIFYCDEKFVTITVEEFQKIIETKRTIKPGVLLNLLLIFKKYAFIGSSDGLIYPSKATITKELGMLSPTTTEKAINALIDIGLVYKDKPYYVAHKSNNGTYVQLRNIYSLSPENFKYTKHKLEQINGESVYTVDEIDLEKVVRLGRK